MSANDCIAEELEAWWAAQEKASWYDRNYLWFDKVFVITLALGIVLGAAEIWRWVG